MRYFNYILTLFIVVLSLYSQAQQYKFQHFSVEEGLPQSQVFAMTQDSRGFIWLGTKGGGLSKFNGKEFTTFTKEEGLTGDQIYSIFEDSKHNLWIGTANGISHYNGMKFTNYAISKQYSIVISSIIEDKNRIIWAATNAGLYFFKNKEWKPFISNNKKLKYNVSCLFIDKNGILWTGNDNGLFKIENNHVTRFTTKSGLSSNKIRSINELNGQLLVATYGHGLNIHNEKGWYVLGEKNEIIHHIFIDNQENIWVSTQDNGVIKYDLKKNSKRFYNQSSGLSANNVRVTLQDSWGNMWFGTSGGGLNKYHGQQFKHYNISDGFKDSKFYSVLGSYDSSIWVGTGNFGVTEMKGDSLIYHNSKTDFFDYKCKALFEDYLGNIWIGTEGKGIYIYTKGKYIQISGNQGLVDNWIRYISQDENHIIWIATVSGISKLTPAIFPNLEFSIKNFRQQNGLPDDRINALLPDYDNRMWFGTNNGHVGYILNDKIVNYGVNDGIKRSVIKSLALDKHNQLWVATEGEGLFYADLNKNFITFKQIKKTDGINSNNIYLLKFDKQGQLWLGAGGGIDRITFSNEGKLTDIKHFGKNEGFLGGETCTNAISVTPDGNIWIGTLDGLNRHNPTQSKTNTIAPKLSVTNISLFYESIAKNVTDWYNVDKLLQFDYNENHISFEYEGVNLKNPDEVYYQFKLEGFDEDWSPISKQNIATYSNLEPSNYMFLIKAKNEDNIWTKSIEIPFVILTPFWRAWWFISGIFIVLISVIILIYRSRQKHLKEEKKRLQLEKNMLEMEQKALRLQMNPHFIFNAMNTVQALIAKKDEIEALENYLNLEKLSNEDNFDFEIIVDEAIQTDAYGIPPLLLQPFAENAIVHGLKKLNHRGKIIIQFDWKKEYIECSVTDNGRGRQATKEIRHQKSSYHKSTALVLTQERLAALSNELPITSFEIIDLETPTGTMIILRIPIIEVF